VDRNYAFNALYTDNLKKSALCGDANPRRHTTSSSVWIKLSAVDLATVRNYA